MDSKAMGEATPLGDYFKISDDQSRHLNLELKIGLKVENPSLTNQV